MSKDFSGHGRWTEEEQMDLAVEMPKAMDTFFKKKNLFEGCFLLKKWHQSTHTKSGSLKLNAAHQLCIMI